jgi:phage portal protein BeeE
VTSFLDRLLGREPVAPVKAASGPGIQAMTYDRPLFTLGQTQQKRMEAYLKAYKVGWFYKAEAKISSTIASLGIHVAPENDEGENESEVIEPDLFAPWLQLDPVGQFLRLMERPNPSQTGRQLRQKTQIRIDMAGAAFWYLESPDYAYGLPSAIYGISPARMWESRDREGNLIGWVMDRDRPGGGVPFETREILPFFTGSADDDVWGVGVVEAVYAEVPLTNLMATHTASVLETGGRLAGMLWPRERTLDQAEFEDAQRAWRSTISNGNAAKRLLLFPEPMEYAQGASTPQEIGIPELATLNRDNILTAFPISPYQLGVPMPGGLNSAETRKEDRRDFYEGTIHPRVELIEETIQVGLLSRYEAAVGYTLDFEIEEPNLDDAPSLLEKAGAVRALVSIGFDAKEAVSAVGLDHIKWNGLPTLLDPAVQAEAAANAATPPDAAQGARVVVRDNTPRDNTATQQTLVGKSTKAEALRSERDAYVEPASLRAKGTLDKFFADQRERVSRAIAASLPTTKAARREAVKADPEWFDAAAEEEALLNAMRTIYLDVGRGALQVVSNRVDRFVGPGFINNVLSDLTRYGGSRITDITERTRKALVSEVSEGVRRGYSIPQIIDGVPAEAFNGVAKAAMDNGVEVFGDARSEMIARTETALSFNRAALRGYGEFGVREVVAFDGDKDAECAARDGVTFALDDAQNITDHPNGTLDWAPVVPYFEKAVVEPQPPVVNVKVDNVIPMPMRTVIEYDDLGRVAATRQEPA